MKLAAALLLIATAILPAQQVAIGEYSTPLYLYGSQAIALGPDGALWFTGGDCNGNGGGIGRISPAGAFRLYNIPTADSCPGGITAGPDGALWFTEYNSDKIGRITTAGVFTEFPAPAGSTPSSITAGPDGALWFTEDHVGPANIGRITTAGVITEYPLANNSVPYGITSGSDGALWFTEHGTIKIGRITTAGAITEYPVSPTTQLYLYGITAGPDGALWFPESGIGENPGKMGRITTAGAISEFPIPGASGNLIGIATGPDKALWFTMASTNQIGRITTRGTVTTYPVPTIDSGLSGITAGPDGAMWFPEFVGKIGEAFVETATLEVTPANGYYRSNLTFTGSGFAPNANVQIYVSGVGSAVLASATADGSGSFTATGVAPESEYGPRIFLGVGAGKLGAASFSMAPRLIPNPDSGSAGTPATVSGYGFGSFEPVNVYWNNPHTLLGRAHCDIHGTFNGSAAFSFTVPSDAPAGSNGIYGRGGITGAVGSGSFTVQ